MSHEISCGRPLSSRFDRGPRIIDRSRRKLSVVGTRGFKVGLARSFLRDWKFTGIGIIVRATIRANHVASHGPFRDRRSWMPMGVFVYTYPKGREIDLKRSSWNGGSGSGLLSYRLTEGSLFILFNFFLNSISRRIIGNQIFN